MFSFLRENVFPLTNPYISFAVLKKLSEDVIVGRAQVPVITNGTHISFSVSSPCIYFEVSYFSNLNLRECENFENCDELSHLMSK